MLIFAHKSKALPLFLSRLPSVTIDPTSTIARGNKAMLFKWSEIRACIEDKNSLSSLGEKARQIGGKNFVCWRPVQRSNWKMR